MTASPLGRARQHANVGLAACRQRSVRARDKCVQRGSSHARRGGASPASCGRVVHGPACPSARLGAARLETYRRRGRKGAWRSSWAARKREDEQTWMRLAPSRRAFALTITLLCLYICLYLVSGSMSGIGSTQFNHEVPACVSRNCDIRSWRRSQLQASNSGSKYDPEAVGRRDSKCACHQYRKGT
jgi:hypothetical protein